MRRTPAFLLSTLLLGTPAANTQQKTSELYDPPATVGMLDLARVPLFIDILQRLGLTLRDKSMEATFTKQFDDLRDLMHKEIAGSKMGYLLSVEAYTDEAGTPIVPSGQLVFAVGKGTEPIDALAESFRRPRMRSPRPQAYASSQSYYIWVKEREGKLTGGMIPREFTDRLESIAKEEADRRDLMGGWFTALPPGGVEKIQRAEYWSDVARKYTAVLDSENRRANIARMTREFAIAQQSFNDAYIRYQDTVAEMTRINAYNATLNSIEKITALVSSAIQTGEVISRQDPAKTTNTIGQPRESLKDSINYIKIRLEYFTGVRDQLRVQVNQKGTQLQKLDTQLKTEFRDGKASIPESDPVLRLPNLP